MEEVLRSHCAYPSVAAEQSLPPYLTHPIVSDDLLHLFHGRKGLVEDTKAKTLKLADSKT